MTDVLQSVETAVENFGNTVKTDLTAAWHGVEGIVEKDAVILWNDAKPLITAVLPSVYADLKAVIAGVLTAFAGGGDLAAIETAVLNVLEAGGTDLFKTAQGLGSNLLQLVISLVKTTL